MRRSRKVSLRTRLAVFLTAMAVVPCAIVTLVGSSQLARETRFWSNPAIARSFTSSLTAARESMHLIEERLVETVAEGARTPGDPPADLDVWRVYRDHPPVLQLESAEASAAGQLVDTETIREALDSGPDHIIEHPDGWLLAVAADDSGRVYLGGYRVSPALLTSIDDAREGARLFGRLDPYTALRTGWVWASLGFVTVLLLAVAVFLSRTLARGITRPIEELVAAMRHVARGEPVPAIAPPDDREMGYLVSSFNDMSDELERSRVQLMRTERLSAWRDVARRVAHEIKNPLTPIQFALHRLKREAGGDEIDHQVLASNLDSIIGEVETLRSMADTFSALGKLPEPQFETLALDTLVQEVLTLYQQEGIEHVVSLPPTLPAVVGDRKQLRQVFNNLIQNATEAMPEGGVLHVEIATAPDQRELVVEILDSGGGVSDASLESIWEPYFTTKTKGSGIGLAVVQKIVHDHRGQIELANRPEGGVRVVLRIPTVLAGNTRRPELERVAGQVPSLLLAIVAAACLLLAGGVARRAQAAPQPYAKPGADIGSDFVLRKLDAMLPDGWAIAESSEDASPFLWSGNAQGLSVKLENRNFQQRHSRGFSFHPFIRLTFCPPEWTGAMDEIDYLGRREPAYLLGTNHIFGVFYQARGMLRWDGVWDELTRTFDLTGTAVDRSLRTEVNRRLETRVAQRLAAVEHDLRDDVLDRVNGIDRQGALLYVEYLATVRSQPAAAGAPPLPPAVRRAIEEETEQLARQLFHVFPEVSTIYMRRLCDNRLFDRLVARETVMARASASPGKALE